MVLLGDADHVADHLQGQRPGELGDQLTLPVGVLRDHRIDESTGPFAYRGFGAGHHLGGESPADDVAQSQMPWVVEHDHRPEELGKLWILVGDRDGWA